MVGHSPVSALREAQRGANVTEAIDEKLEEVAIACTIDNVL